MDNLISSPQIVARYKISYQTLNYYTNLGLLHVITKQGNKRLYKESEIRHNLVKIQGLKNEGYTLRLIRKILNG
ncbi:MAG: MerR family transcriptional regulator [Candidatus Omnitrophica bacterium]|nr:MerR family transcriptional regulator [Candidatus Omnitrophota bacterium]MDD5653426.1 MerR family transcriptional regulator [Candidatus Omnitrophota bacterium]